MQVDRKYYRGVLQKKQMLPVICHNAGSTFVFQQGSTPAHRAHEIVQPHRIFSLQICGCLTVQIWTSWLPKLGTDADACTGTRPRHQWPKAAPLWHIGQHITKHHRWSCRSMEKAVLCKPEGERTSLSASVKLNLIFSKPWTIYRGKHVMLIISVAAI